MSSEELNKEASTKVNSNIKWLSIATLTSSIIAGLLWDRLGASAPFLFGGSLALISSFLMMIIMFTHKNIDNSQFS